MVNAAAYKYELSANQFFYLSNQGEFTTLTVASHASGQQQQSGNRFSTGKWTAAPVLYRLAQGVMIAISAAQETYYLQIQGGQTQLSAGRTADIAAQLERTQPTPMQRTDEMPAPSMQPMTPMQPMQPMHTSGSPMSMSMGDMEMSPGEMRMGDMKLSSSSAGAVSSSASSSRTDGSVSANHQTDAQADAQAGVKRFCAQCGSAIQPDDRFCAYCGDRLQ